MLGSIIRVLMRKHQIFQSIRFNYDDTRKNLKIGKHTKVGRFYQNISFVHSLMTKPGTKDRAHTAYVLIFNLSLGYMSGVYWKAGHVSQQAIHRIWN